MIIVLLTRKRCAVKTISFILSLFLLACNSTPQLRSGSARIATQIKSDGVSKENVLTVECNFKWSALKCPTFGADTTDYSVVTLKIFGPDGKLFYSTGRNTIKLCSERAYEDDNTDYLKDDVPLVYPGAHTSICELQSEGKVYTSANKTLQY